MECCRMKSPNETETPMLSLNCLSSQYIWCAKTTLYWLTSRIQNKKWQDVIKRQFFASRSSAQWIVSQWNTFSNHWLYGRAVLGSILFYLSIYLFILGVNKADLEELSLGLEDRTFVDYFNIFLSLPVSTPLKQTNNVTKTSFDVAPALWRNGRKHTVGHVHKAKIRISLRIRAV